MSFNLKKKYGSNLMMMVRDMVDAFSDLRVLVIGDIIIDSYIFCNVQGLTMKDATLSTSYDYDEVYECSY